MAYKTIDLGKSTITFEDNRIAHLHIKKGQIIDLDEVKEIFEVISQEAKGGLFRLMVSASEEATLSSKSREYASTKESSDVIVADAVVVENYSHEMTSNFFIRFNKPNRPTKLFKNVDEAKKWLLTHPVE